MTANIHGTHRNQVIDLTTKIAVVSSVLVILAAAVLSFTALYDLFLQIGLFAGWLAVLFPLLFDLAELAAAVTVLNAKLQGENDRFAWGLVIGFTVAGMGANIAHAAHAWHIERIDSAQFVLAVVFTSLFPLSIALVTHLLKRTIERTIKRAEAVTTLAELTRQAAALTRQRDALTVQVDALKAERDALNVDISGNVQEMTAKRQAEAGNRKRQALAMLSEGMSQADIAETLGVTQRTVKRYLNGSGVTQ